MLHKRNKNLITINEYNTVAELILIQLSFHLYIWDGRANQTIPSFTCNLNCCPLYHIEWKKLYYITLYYIITLNMLSPKCHL